MDFNNQETHNLGMPNRDENSGKFTEEYPDKAFLDAVEQIETPTTVQISNEVGCSYNLAYRRLKELVEKKKVQCEKIGSSFVWESV